MRLLFIVEARHVRRHWRRGENTREIEALRLPMLDALARVEQLGSADELVQGPYAELRHQLARLLGDVEEVVHHVLGLVFELAAQHGVLRRHTDRAGVQVALAHHDAALDHERRRGKAELVRAEDRADDDIAAGLHLPVDLHHDAASQAIQNERLLRLGQTELPGRARMLDRGPRRGAGAAVVPGDRDVVGLALRYAGGDRADAHLGDELHRDRGVWIGIFQIVDELCQVLDRIDVVVWRRRDELDARRRIAQLGDVLGHLATGQLSAFARFRALRDLDLQHLRARQVLGGDAEAAGGDLLDLRLERVAFAQRDIDFDAPYTEPRHQALADFDRRITTPVLAALPGVGTTADAIHGNRERGVRFGRDRAERHRAGRKALHDFRGRFDLFDWNRSTEAELEQPAEGHVAPRLVVDDRGVLFVRGVGVGAGGVLQLGNRLGGPGV